MNARNVWLSSLLLRYPACGFVRDLDRIIQARGKPKMIVSDNVLSAEKNEADGQSLYSPACSRRMTLVQLHSRTRWLPLVGEKVSSIATQGTRDGGLTVLNTSF